MDFADYPQPPNGDFDLFKQENRDNLIHQDLGLDPSDPLNLLLNNSSQDSSMEDANSSHGTPPDWSQLSSSLWSNQGSMQQGNLSENMKYPGLGMDFLQVDLGFNPSMAVDPSALHYDSHGYNPGYDMSGYQNQHLATEFLSAPFPFTFNSHPVSGPIVSNNDFSSQVKERRLSVTSSSESSSGASLSPVLEHSSAVAVSNDPADELAQRVRQAAGVMLAVSAGPSYQQQQLQPQAKLPIPRLPSQSKLNAKAQRLQPKSSTPSSASSATSSPPPTSPSDDAASNNAPVHISGTSVIPRPKTSHTTIERRYRTNLNARIQSLRQAVPALRVLEEKNKKAKTDGEESEKPSVDVDVVDERGFVDGVKVARKGSKATVLGKAVEYIRVLKKREARLKREQNGLKSLITGLVGGHALLRQWEHEWKEKFGGEEKDEIEGEEAEPMSDDDDGDEEGDGDEDDGRAKKKAKVVKAPKKEITKKPAVQPTTDALGSIVVPEKRKRGRPRKVPVPTSPEDPSLLIPSGNLAVQPMVQDGQAQPVQQYLLATFALFSLFNSPFTYSASSQPHPHSYSGTVLSHISVPSSPSLVVPSSYGWRELVHTFHLIVSALVFFSIVVPWLPMTFKRTRLASVMFSVFSSYFPHSNAAASPPQPAQCLPPSQAPDGDTLIEALSHTRRGAPDEAYQLHAALGVPAGMLGLVTGWRKSGGGGFERKGLEQRAWVRLGELVALDRTTSIATRLQTYWCMRSHISWFKASTSDLSTLALILRPLSSAKANTLWNRAGKTDIVRPFERLVLTSLTVDEAAGRLALVQRSADHTKHTPIGLLASILIRERLLKHASVLFVRTVLPDRCHASSEDSWVIAEQDNLEEDEKRKETIDAGKSLGGRTRELAEALEKIWGTGAGDVEDVLDHREGGSQKGDEAEVELRALLSALILYRRIFPSSILSSASAPGTEPVSFILSPPPSPSRQNPDLHLSLRRVLGSAVFDSTFSEGDAGDAKLDEEQRGLSIALEDARDRVVDMLVEGERAGRKAYAAAGP